MAATTTPTPDASRGSRFRLSTMEVLGFIETPGSAMASTITWVDTTSDTAASPPPRPVSDDPFSGWDPSELARRFTGSGVRWGMVAAVLALLGLLGMAAVWVYQRPQVHAESARQAALAGITELSASLTGLDAINQSLTGPSMDSIEVNTVMLAVDPAVRRVFAAAADLPSSLGVAKTRLVDATGDTADALRLFGDAYAYRSGVIPILARPVLEIDSALVTLEEAAAAFSEWQARFEAVRSSVPDGPLADANAALASLSSALPQIQRDYLDALRVGDGAASQVAVDLLASGLTVAEQALFTDLEELQARIGALIEEAATDLETVRSLLG